MEEENIGMCKTCKWSYYNIAPNIVNEDMAVPDGCYNPMVIMYGASLEKDYGTKEKCPMWEPIEENTEYEIIPLEISQYTEGIIIRMDYFKRENKFVVTPSKRTRKEQKTFERFLDAQDYMEEVEKSIVTKYDLMYNFTDTEEIIAILKSSSQG